MQKSSAEDNRRSYILLAVLAFALIVIAIGITLSDGGDDGPPGPTTTTTEPPVVDGGPYQDEITDALKDAGFSDRDDWDDDWDEVGIVTEVGEKSLKVMTTKEFVFLTSGGGGNECVKPIPITDIGSSGDIVAWLNEGEDSIVCDGEMALLWDAPKEKEPAKS